MAIFCHTVLRSMQAGIDSCRGAAAADANILINTARLAAQRHLLTYQEPIPVEQLVRALCDNKQVQYLAQTPCMPVLQVLWH